MGQGRDAARSGTLLDFSVSRTMSGSPGTLAAAADTLTLLNHTTTEQALGQDMSASIHEFKVFNITMTSLALVILTVTAVLCSISLIRRRRQSKQARVYESAVGGFEAASLPTFPSTSSSSRGTDSSSGLALLLRREVRCSLRRPLSLLRGREAPKDKDNSRIYYIYTNPLPVGKDEDEEEAEEEEEERRRRRMGTGTVEESGAHRTPVGATAAGGGKKGKGGRVEELLPSLDELAQDPNSGITLSSETFYMQL